MDLLSIASGSSGNCYYVGSEETHLLVDAGVSGKKIESALNEIDRKPSDLNGILVTHEHIDHVKGLGVMARKHGIPIYTTGGTISEIKKMSSVGTNRMNHSLSTICRSMHQRSGTMLLIRYVTVSVTEKVNFPLQQIWGIMMNML